MTPVPPVRDCWDQFRAEPLIPEFASSSEGLQRAQRSAENVLPTLVLHFKSAVVWFLHFPFLFEMLHLDQN